MCMFNVSGPGMKGMVGMAGRIFSAVSRAGVSIVLITQSSSEYSVSFCIHSYDSDKTRKVLEREFELEFKNQLLDPLEIMTDLAIISLIGDGMRTSKGMAARFFTSLAQASINIVAIAHKGSSERSISAVVRSGKVAEAIKACHQNFFGSQQFIDLFVVGVGGVGAALVDQIARQQPVLAEQGTGLRVVGIANSRQMAVNKDGLALANWREQLVEAQGSFSLEAVKKLVEEPPHQPGDRRCTSSEAVAVQYADFLGAGFHVVTPNKKANTGSLDYYKALRRTARQTRRKFLYETNVGAGLPVIENLQNLIKAGDKLRAFDGILSGSLSFIFGKLDEGWPSPRRPRSPAATASPSGSRR